MTRKIYSKHYAVLLDSRDLVIWACGNEEWQQFYKPHPKLKYERNFATWTMESKIE